MDPFVKFLWIVFSVFMALLMTIAAVNYRYDPANLFGGDAYEAGIARLLSEGKNVANVTDYDERVLQKYYVEQLSSSKDVLVLGSSRSMNIGARQFPGKAFFNASVSGATLEDYYAIIQLYRARNLLPNMIVLGVDPWIFNQNNGQTRWKSLEAEYRQSLFLKKPGEVRLTPAGGKNLSRYQQLFSLDYFQASIKTKKRKARGYYATSDTQLDVNIRIADGSISYRREFALRKTEEVSEVARRMAAKKPLYSLDKFSELDPTYISRFEGLIARLREEGVEVVLFLPPYHPDMYAAMMNKGSSALLVAEAERYIRRFAEQQHLFVLGAYAPDSALCDRDEFFDEMHPRPTCINKIFSEFNRPK